MSDVPEVVEEFVPVDQIVVENRYRVEKHSARELDDLGESVAAVGLLHPIVVTRDNHLLAGEGRLTALKSRGEKLIRVRRLDFDSTDRAKCLRVERDENVARKEFTPGEKVRITKDLIEAISKGLIPKVPGKERIKQATEIAGISEREYHRAKEVIESGDQEIIDKMEAGDLPAYAAVNELKAKHSNGGPAGHMAGNTFSAGRSAGRPAGPAPKKEVPAVVVLDQLGQEVSGHHRDVFADNTMDETAVLLERAAALLVACSKWHKYIPDAIIQQVKDLSKTVGDMIPYAICPDCKGPGCPSCRHTGWMPTWTYTEYMARG